MASNSKLSPSDDNSSETDLSLISTEDEKQIDTTGWTPVKQKKLQHMKEFHKEYQCIFSEKASICTIMKNRITHMNPPIPDSVCKEEMQNASQNNDVIIEYITDAQGRKVKRLKPLLIKSKTDREYIHHVHSDNNLPHIPKENFIQKREIMINSYSETISSESSSEDRTLTEEMEDTVSSMEDHIEDRLCLKEDTTTATEIEASLHQIATSLQNAAEGYMSLASCIHKLESYEIPKIIAQIPPPPINVPLPIRKTLTIDDEEKVLNHLLRGEYELTNTSWSKLQRKHDLTRGRIYNALKGKRRPGGLQYHQMKKHCKKCARKLETTTTNTRSESD